jgi:hypothetical protein
MESMQQSLDAELGATEQALDKELEKIEKVAQDVGSAKKRAISALLAAHRSGEYFLFLCYSSYCTAFSRLYFLNLIRFV